MINVATLETWIVKRIAFQAELLTGFLSGVKF